MGRTARAVFISSLALPLFLTACASDRKPLPPPVDPLKEQITILQKQLLELQNVQNEIRRKVDEQGSVLSTLNTRVETLESHRAAQRPAPAVNRTRKSTNAARRKTATTKRSAKRRTAKRKRTRTP